jgi:hypothetical protein
MVILDECFENSMFGESLLIVRFNEKSACIAEDF